MIVRSSFRCLTCRQDHVVRIGMGHDNRQLHRFPCRGCGEEMVIALNVHYETVSTSVEAIENAEKVDEAPDALIVNVHANFVIDEAGRFTDRSFPHMRQMHAHLEAAKQFGLLNSSPAEGMFRDRPRPFRRPDFADEWHLLKKAWSLHSRGQDKLSAKMIATASERYHFDEPIDHLPDWVWRFCMFLGAKKYDMILHSMIGDVKEAISEKRLAFLLKAYEQESEARANRYFEVVCDYFSAWNEFSQVHFAVSHGMSISEGHVATTSGFNSVKMFYGSAFEAFASSVDILAFMNNVLEGREWTRFRTIDAKTYLRSDKARRFDALASRAAFTDLCQERDNQLRNASHHGELHFDSEQGMLSYRPGKGNSSDLVTIPYAEYLSRCSAIFLQTVTLLRFELAVCQLTGTRYPI